MPWISWILAALLGYLIGSIPSGYIVARLRGVDITHEGSGRTGGTNVFRSLGLRYGLLTGFMDVFKGVLAVVIARWIFGAEGAAALAGAFAVIGHNWSIFLRFRGGAGGGTGVGALVALNPLAGLILVPIFAFILVVGRYASVATLSVGLGSLVILASLYAIGQGTPLSHIVFAISISIAIVWTLRPNLMRLIAGNERRINLHRS